MELDTIVCGDCLSTMENMPDECVDLIIVDAPYGIGYASGWDTQMNGSPRKTDRSFGKDIFDATWLSQAYRVAKKDTSLYLFTRWDILYRWKEAIEKASYKVVQRIVWDKKHWGMGNLDYFGNQTEDILFCIKGKPKLNWEKRQGNIWQVWKGEMWHQGGHSGHPTEKPLSLIEKMITLSSNQGELIFDPFIGSGTTAVAAMKVGRHFYGCDISPEYVKLANKRIEKAKLEMAQLRMAV